MNKIPYNHSLFLVSLATFAFGFQGRANAQNADAAFYLEEVPSAWKISFSPDAKYLAVIGSNAVHLRNTKTWRPPCPPLDHGLTVHRAQFSADSRYILTISSNRAWWELPHREDAVLWVVQTGEPKGNPFRHQGARLLDAALSPDGKFVATIGHGVSSVCVWNTVTQALVRILNHASNATFVQFSPNGRSLITTGEPKEDGSQGAETKIWDVASGELRWALPQGGISARFGQVEPAQGATNRLAIETSWGAAVYDIGTSKLIYLNDNIVGRLGAKKLTLSHDGSVLGVYESGAGVTIWDTVSGERMLADSSQVAKALISPDGSATVVVESEPREGDVISIRETRSGKLLRAMDVGRFDGGLFSPDGRLLLLQFDHKTMIIPASRDRHGQLLPGAARWSSNRSK